MQVKGQATSLDMQSLRFEVRLMHRRQNALLENLARYHGILHEHSEEEEELMALLPQARGLRPFPASSTSAARRYPRFVFHVPIINDVMQY